jgi:hypothetical protein
LSGSSSTGVDWTDDEIDLIVADYFDMLTMEIKGIPFVKAQRNHDLRTMMSRSRGSIERKHQKYQRSSRKIGHALDRRLQAAQQLSGSVVGRH